jgi:transcriptional regulator with XRE-family HTH domain
MAVTKMRIIRETRGLTQTQQAKRLAVSLATYRPIEAGVLKPSARIRDLLEAEFGYDPDFLLESVRLSDPLPKSGPAAASRA